MPALLIWKRDAAFDGLSLCEQQCHLAEIRAQRNPVKLTSLPRQLSRSETRWRLKPPLRSSSSQTRLTWVSSSTWTNPLWWASWLVGPRGAMFIADPVTNDVPSSSHGRYAREAIFSHGTMTMR